MRSSNRKRSYSLKKLSVGLVSVFLGSVLVMDQGTVDVQAQVSQSFASDHSEVAQTMPETDHDRAVAEELANVVNELRQLNGLNPLTFNQELEDAARLSVYDDVQADKLDDPQVDKLSHIDDYNRLADVGYISQELAVEYEEKVKKKEPIKVDYSEPFAQANLAWESSTGELDTSDARQVAERIVNSWTADIGIESRGHRVQMLATHWTEVGSGHAIVKKQADDEQDTGGDGVQENEQMDIREQRYVVQYYGTGNENYELEEPAKDANTPFKALPSYAAYLDQQEEY